MTIDSRRERWLWPLVAIVAAMVPMGRGLDPSVAFAFRDLTFFFHPFHVWLRDSLFAGNLPLWNPSPAFGQSTIADPTYHLLFPPAILLRFLPAAIGFNLYVALPMPVAAAGTYVLLVKRCSRRGAALGAVVFALSGAMLSTANMANLSWTSALVPWVLWAASALGASPTAPRFAALAAAFALQALAAESVVLLATAMAAPLAAATAADKRTRVRALGLSVAAGLTGALLAMPQLLPAAAASARSTRFAVRYGLDWSLHPLRLLEVPVSGIFGVPGTTAGPWRHALDGPRGPFLLSLYVGAPALALAAIALLRDRRRALAWTTLLLVILVLAFGEHMPVLSALRWVFPSLQHLRYPSKLVVLAMLPLAYLAAAGWEAIGRAECDLRRLQVAAGLCWVAAAIAGGLALGLSLGFEPVLGAARAFVATAGAPDPMAAARDLRDGAVPGLVRFVLLSAGTGMLLWGAAAVPVRATALRLLLLLVVVLDLASANAGLTPVVDAELLDRPRWTELAASCHERSFVRGRTAFMHLDEADQPGVMSVPAELGAGSEPANWELALCAAPWGIREAVSYDPSSLWPREYSQALRRYVASGPAERERFLRASGARFFLTNSPPEGGREIGRAEFWRDLRLYEIDGATPRAIVVPAALIEPDRARQVDLLVAGEIPKGTLLLEAEPPAAAGAPTPPSAEGRAEFLVDDGEQVTLRASAPAGGGYLLLADTFDPDWEVSVDGAPATLLRANGLFRCVRIAEGEHVVAFGYTPTMFYLGTVLSALTATVLVAAALWRGRRAVSS